MPHDLGSGGPSDRFGPGSGHFLSQADIDQLKRIIEVVGTPSPEVLAKMSSEHVSPQPPASSGGRGDGPGALCGVWATA